jgi:hypothetical protein
MKLVEIASIRHVPLHGGYRLLRGLSQYLKAYVTLGDMMLPKCWMARWISIEAGA